MASVSSPIEAKPEGSFLPGIEVLRGVAAIAVVFHHSFSLSTQPHFFGYQIIEGFGEWGVDLFFCLSGFLLAEYFWNRSRKPSVGAFYIRRYFRIAPAYYVNLVILFVFFANHDALFSTFGLKQTAANLTFTHYLTPGTSSSLNVNGAMWTLTIEMLLYLFMPLMALLMLRRPALSVAGFVGLGVAWRLYVARLATGTGVEGLFFGTHNTVSEGIRRLFLQRQFIGALPLFALGMGLRWLMVSGRLPARLTAATRHPSVLKLLLLLVPSVLSLAYIERASNYQHWIWFSFFDLVMCLLMLPAFLYAARPIAVPVTGVLRAGQWMGERSYGLYLWHFPVILSVYGMGPLLHPPEVSYIWARLLLIFVVSVGLAAASYSLVEHPAREWGRRLSRRVSRPSPVVVSDAVSPEGVEVGVA
jgi:peptidoglycan/LPS O-acetylase OafA/YrhL